MNYFEATCMIQTRSTTGFETFETGPFLPSLQKIIKKNLLSTKDHIATIFDPLSNLVVTKEHTCLNKPAAEIYRFV